MKPLIEIGITCRYMYSGLGFDKSNPYNNTVMDLHRHSTRLPKLDYSSHNTFFVTICTHKHGCVFWDTILAREVERVIIEVQRRYNNKIEKYVVMPNHVHLLVEIGGGSRTVGASLMKPLIEIGKTCRHMGVINHAPTLGQIVRYIKAKSTFMVRKNGYAGILWQRNYYEHKIRNEEELRKYTRYVELNLKTWERDEYHPKMSLK